MAVSQLGTPTGNSGSGTSPSCAHTVASGSNVVSYIFLYAGNDTTVTSPLFAGVTPTLVNTPGDGDMHIYRVVSPSTGSTSFTATMSDFGLWSVFIYTLQGVDIADPDDTVQVFHDAADPVAPNTVVVSTATGDRVVAFGLIVGANIAANSGSTVVLEAESIDTAYLSSVLVMQDGNGTVTIGLDSSDFCCDSYVEAFNVNAAGSGAAYELDLDQGSYALNGQVAGLAAQAKQLVAEFGSYTLLGSDAYREIQMNAEFGSYSLNGQVVDLTTPIENVSLVAEFGTYTLTGAEAFRDIFINMDSGSYSFNGQTAGLAYGRRLTTENGLYNIEGFPAALLWDGAPDSPPPRFTMRRRFFGYRLGR